MIFLIKDGGGGERERLHVCMLPIKQEKGIVGSWIALLPRYCLLWVPHVLLISIINGQDLCFFFFCSKFCHFLTKNLGIFGKKILL